MLCFNSTHWPPRVLRLNRYYQPATKVVIKSDLSKRNGEKNHIFTQIISAFLTVFTVAAGFSGLKGHPVPGYQIRHALSRFNHNAARFVTQHKGRLYHIVPDSS